MAGSHVLDESMMNPDGHTVRPLSFRLQRRELLRKPLRGARSAELDFGAKASAIAKDFQALCQTNRVKPTAYRLNGRTFAYMRTAGYDDAAVVRVHCPTRQEFLAKTVLGLNSAAVCGNRRH